MGHACAEPKDHALNPPLKGNIMQRLLNIYRTKPTPANRAKLQAYLNKHMMAVCLASPEDIAFLKAHEFTI
jgi:hypothetical protein